ncbi:uncharacterized protein N0V89_010127 [Didymosphaeria variabile]|uniref:Protein kinase domain-containing protein n=1 Tax=Didymosphaeria variabile TaxID=1932322 RepID=A0A9W9C8T1_9PLEO|nr:uncharacterized protein N0V89_010127 [Didymosphaeria variabile]KAJ4348749.1 hypothetical protein N0V89_010127 [Didymosphaeria variabile]
MTPKIRVKIEDPSVQTYVEECNHALEGLDKELHLADLEHADSLISSEPCSKDDTASFERHEILSSGKPGNVSHGAVVSGSTTTNHQPHERRRSVVVKHQDRTVIIPRARPVRPQPVKRKSSGFPFRALQHSQTFDVVKSIAVNVSRKAIKLCRWPDRTRKRPESLKERLNTARELSPFCDQHFIPLALLEELITHDVVAKELARDRSLLGKLRLDADKRGLYKLKSRSTNRLLIQESERTYRKVFAVLTLIDQASCIWKFVDEGICDSTLPISAEQIDKSQHHFRLRSEDTCKPLKCFQDWSPKSIADFMKSQWEVIALHFKGGLDAGNHYEVQPDEVLPFTKFNNEYRKGGFGQVFTAEIEESHRSFPNKDVAVKRLTNTYEDPVRNREAFKHESGILRSLAKQTHINKHLTELLTTFERANEFYLVFPWADTDLEGFWEQHSPQPELSGWLLEQFRGLSEALYVIHRYQTTKETTIPYQGSIMRTLPTTKVAGSEPLNFLGRHGDIKPHNILFFGQGGSKIQHGILKITDFGITRFTPENIVSERDKGNVPNSPTYRSPECDLRNIELSSQCDIWALGCVYLVFLTWYLGNHKEVKDFANERMSPDLYLHGIINDSFFTIDPDESAPRRASVKSSVKAKINDLRCREACTEPFQQLIHMIENGMIIVIEKEPEGLAVPSHHHRRLSSSSIMQKLETMSHLNGARDDEEESPRTPRHRLSMQ